MITSDGLRLTANQDVRLSAIVMGSAPQSLIAKNHDNPRVPMCGITRKELSLNKGEVLNGVFAVERCVPQ